MADRDELRRRFEGLLGVAATEGSEVTMLCDGVGIFAAMLEQVRSAGESVDLLTYIAG